MQLSKLNGIFNVTAPLRIPIAGGGTDLPEYYTKHGATWLSLSIDKKVQIIAHKNIDDNFLIHYKKNENCDTIDDIQHPIIREMLKDFDINEPLVIHSISELTGNSGLGSSGAFALCFAKFLSQITGKYIQNLPEYVFNFERNVLQEFVGKQDQYAAYTGGLNIFEADKSGNVNIKSFLSRDKIEKLCDHFVLVKAGAPRFAKEALKKQAHNLRVDAAFENKYHKVKEIAFEVIDILKKEDITSYGLLVEKHWQNKLSTFNNNFHKEVFEVDALLKNAGAVGTKLCGAGDSGFMLGIFESKEKALQFIDSSEKIAFSIKPDFVGLN